MARGLALGLALGGCAGQSTPRTGDGGSDAATTETCDPVVARGATDCAAVNRCQAAGGICANATSFRFDCLAATDPAIACESRAFTSSCCVPSACHVAGGICLPQCFADAGGVDAGCGQAGDVCCTGQL